MRTSLSFKVDSWESIPNFVINDGTFSNEELEKISSYCFENGGELKEGEVGLGKNFGLSKEIRDSQIKFFRIQKDNSWIFHKLKNIVEKVNDDYYNFDLVGFDRFQYSEYNGEGTKYDFHPDAFFGKKDSGLMRKLSLSLLLSDPEKDFEGGNFEIFTGRDLKLEPKKGRIILFPSWVIHRVAPIIKGNRKSIVVWVLGPKFK